MTIHADVFTALAGVASGQVFPDFAPQGTSGKYVIVRRIANEPLYTLTGYAGASRSSFVFECNADSKAEALDLADDVIAAIDAAAGLTNKYREPVSGEDFEPETMQLMEPVQYSFWHA
jgi:hypothetical protein